MLAAKIHSSGKNYRQRRKYGVALPGAPSHLGLQAQCQLPIGQQDKCQLPIFILPAGAIASDAVVVLCCPVRAATSASRPSAIRQHSSFRGKRCRQQSHEDVVPRGDLGHLGLPTQSRLPIAFFRPGYGEERSRKPMQSHARRRSEKLLGVCAN